MPDNNTRQALFPQDSTILENPIGTAPRLCSMKIGRGNFLLSSRSSGGDAENDCQRAGCSYESGQPSKDPHYYKTETISTFGLGESALEEKMMWFRRDIP